MTRLFIPILSLLLAGLAPAPAPVQSAPQPAAQSPIEADPALSAQGDPYANLILGLMYQQGQGVDPDIAAAHAYYGRAAEYGDDRGALAD